MSIFIYICTFTFVLIKVNAEFYIKWNMYFYVYMKTNIYLNTNINTNINTIYIVSIL